MIRSIVYVIGAAVGVTICATARAAPAINTSDVAPDGGAAPARLPRRRFGRSAYARQATQRHRGADCRHACQAPGSLLRCSIDNSTTEQGNELGTWVGYRIVKAYYQCGSDKQQALREILEMSDPKAFLAQSGWRPGKG